MNLREIWRYLRQHVAMLRNTAAKWRTMMMMMMVETDYRWRTNVPNGCIRDQYGSHSRVAPTTDSDSATCKAARRKDSMEKSRRRRTRSAVQAPSNGRSGRCVCESRIALSHVGGIRWRMSSTRRRWYVVGCVGEWSLRMRSAQCGMNEVYLLWIREYLFFEAKDTGFSLYYTVYIYKMEIPIVLEVYVIEISFRWNSKRGIVREAARSKR